MLDTDTKRRLDRPGQKDNRFVLASPSLGFDSEEEAVTRAASDFSEACRGDDISRAGVL